MAVELSQKEIVAECLRHGGYMTRLNGVFKILLGSRVVWPSELGLSNLGIRIWLTNQKPGGGIG